MISINVKYHNHMAKAFCDSRYNLVWLCRDGVLYLLSISADILH